MSLIDCWMAAGTVGAVAGDVVGPALEVVSGVSAGALENGQK